MGTLLVGFGNKARHGKDFVASEVHALLPRETRLYSFATSLKVLARVFGMREKDGPLLQALGTDVFRKVDSDIWVRVLKYQIEEEAPKCALLTDVRFPNEANYIRNNGGILVRVVRTHGSVDGVTIPWVAPDRDPNHPSEVALDDYPFDLQIVAASGDLDTLREDANNMARNIRSELLRRDEA